MKKISLIFLCLTMSLCAWGQDEVKALEQAIANASGLEKARLHNQLATLLLDSDLPQVWHETESAISLVNRLRAYAMVKSKKNPYSKRDLLQTQIFSNLIRGEACFLLDQRRDATKAFQEVLRLSKQINYQEGIQVATESLRNLENEQGEKPKSLRALVQTLKKQLKQLVVEEKPAETVMLDTWLSQANTYEKAGKYRDAIFYYKKALGHYESKEDSTNIKAVRKRLSGLYFAAGEHEMADLFADDGVSYRPGTSIISPTQPESSASAQPVDKPKVRMSSSQARDLLKKQKEAQTRLQEFENFDKAGDYENAAKSYQDYRELESEIDRIQRQYNMQRSLAKARELEISTLQLRDSLQQKQLDDTRGILETEVSKSRSLAITVGLLGICTLLILTIFVMKRRSHKKMIKTYNQLDDAHRELQATQIQLIESEKMASLGQLTAGIAHEINNPVNFISGNIYPLKRDIDDMFLLLNQYEQTIKAKGLQREFVEVENYKKSLEIDMVKAEIQELLSGMEQGVARTSEIVQELRTFAKLDEAEIQKVDLHQNIDVTLSLLSNRLKNVTVERLFGNLPKVEVYPKRINQVFMNVVSNALDAIEQKQDSGKIKITSSQDKKSIQITIEDNGSGIPKNIQSKIFDPFFTTKEVGAGKGLGLAVCKGIMERHGGDITISSSKGKGTQVILSLPFDMQKSKVSA